MHFDKHGFNFFLLSWDRLQLDKCFMGTLAMKLVILILLNAIRYFN